MNLAQLLGNPRPIILFDLETTSAEVQTARILSLGMRVHRTDGTIIPYRSLVNPGIAIPEESTKAHGIRDEHIQTGCARCWKTKEEHPHFACEEWKPVPKFSDIAANLHRGFSDADFGGYNVRFDLAVIAEEFARERLVFDYNQAKQLDGLRLWQKLEPRTLSDAVRYFLKREHKGAHDAVADIEETEDVIIAQLTAHPNSSNLPKSLSDIHDLCFPLDPNRIDATRKFVFIGGVPCFNFGKHRGKPMASDVKYLQWMAGQDFSDEVKQIIQEALNGRFPIKR